MGIEPAEGEGGLLACVLLEHGGIAVMEANAGIQRDHVSQEQAAVRSTAQAKPLFSL